MNFLSRSFCGLFLLVCAAMGAGAQGVGSLAGEKLPVVPYPAEIVAGNEDFCVADRQCVNVSSKEAEDVFAVSTFTSDFKNVNWNVKNGKGKCKRNITIARPGNDRNADEIIKNAGLKPDASNKEAYVLFADRDGVVIEAYTAAGVFYGIQTLRQLTYEDASGNLKVRAVKISDAPALKYRWLMDDWNRGPIPNVEYVKKQIRILSEYKINGYCIYGDNIFE